MDFFVSFTRADRRWAEWIAWQLEAAGYTTVWQGKDFKVGNFVDLMHKAIDGTDHAIAILSDQYNKSRYGQLEWKAVVAKGRGHLLPVRVSGPQPKGLLRGIIYLDLKNMDERAAKKALLERAALLCPGRRRVTHRPARSRPPFPNHERPAVNRRERTDAKGLVPASPLRCPKCHVPLVDTADATLKCMGCEWEWAMNNGIRSLLAEPTVRRRDWNAHFVYERIARFHDPAIEAAGMVVHGQRKIALDSLDMPALLHECPRRDPRILEVGIGTGANLPLLDGLIPRHLKVWGVDLSVRMLTLCKERLSSLSHMTVALYRADAHELPFQDGLFARVFFIGGLGAVGNQQKVLSEMARVARHNTPIVVVDEELTDDREVSFLERAAFKMITLPFYGFQEPRRPNENELPAGAHIIENLRLNSFYYCLSFEMRDSGRGI